MTVQKKERRTNGFSHKEDPIFVCPGLSQRVKVQHGAVGWRCDLRKQIWHRVVFDQSLGWVPYELKDWVYKSSDLGDVACDKYED